MVIEKLRQHAREQAALEQAERDAKTRKRRSRKRARSAATFGIFSPALAAHSIFLPALGLWGAAMAGLSVLMLSNVTIARITMVAGLGALGSGAAYLYAALAAVIGGAVAVAAAFVIQRLAKRSRRDRSVAAGAGRRVRPIDPASELGSESLDAPIEDMPFSAEREDVDSPHDSDIPPELYDTQAPEETPLELEDALAMTEEGAAETAPEESLDARPAPSLETEAQNDDEPAALDLSAFDALDETPPAVEERVAETAEETPDANPGSDANDAPVAPEPARSGVEKLRQAAPDDLSLVQLVERFAAALHDIQDRAPRALAEGAIPAGNSERERALAEALKALALFSERGFNQPEPASDEQPKGLPGSVGASFGGQADRASAISETEQQLRDALSKLQNLRGAA